MAKAPQHQNAEPCFENCLAELETIVAQLEAGEKPLDESLALYEKGVAALKRCHEMLDKAEQRIRLLVRGPGGAPNLRDAEVAPRPGSSSRAASAVQQSGSAPTPPDEELDVEVEGETEIEEPAEAPPMTVPEKRSAKPSSRRGDPGSLFRSNDNT